MGFVIERTARYEDAEVFDRTIKIRVKYSIREMTMLNKNLVKFQELASKIDKDTTDNRIEAFESAINQCLACIVAGEEDRKFISDAILDVDPESDDIIDIGEFIQFVQYALKADDAAAEEDTGKAPSGSEDS